MHPQTYALSTSWAGAIYRLNVMSWHDPEDEVHNMWDSDLPPVTVQRENRRVAEPRYLMIPHVYRLIDTYMHAGTHPYTHTHTCEDTSGVRTHHDYTPMPSPPEPTHTLTHPNPRTAPTRHTQRATTPLNMGQKAGAVAATRSRHTLSAKPGQTRHRSRLAP
jgi:hypothetical protein